MSTNTANLQGLVRDKLGTRSARVLRLQGRIPCSIQGEGKGNLDLSIDERVFTALRRQHAHLFDIEVDKGDQETAMVRELHWDTFGTQILHVEFRRVVRGQKTEVEVELEFTGHPKGGVLNHIFTHIPVRCLPSQIPDVIEVSVDALEQGHPLFAKDLKMPEGSEVALDPDTQIAVVSAVRADNVATDEDEEEVEGGAPAPE